MNDKKWTREDLTDYINKHPEEFEGIDWGEVFKPGKTAKLSDLFDKLMNDGKIPDINHLFEEAEEGVVGRKYFVVDLREWQTAILLLREDNKIVVFDRTQIPGFQEEHLQSQEFGQYLISIASIKDSWMDLFDYLTESMESNVVDISKWRN